MPVSQRNIYRNLKNQLLTETQSYRGFPKQIHKPTICDVGCGLGIGANILSQEAQFVWGIDVDLHSIEFARQMFERQPNNIYYTPQLTFDVIDIHEEDRGLMTFDYVTCIEVIEHLPADSADQLVSFLNRLFKKDKAGAYLENEERTKAFVSTPNRNSPNIADATPNNEHHCFEATAGELYEFFTKKYRAVTVYDEHMVPQELDTTATPLVFKLELPYA